MKDLLDAARAAFVDSMGTAVWVAVGVVLVGALVSLVFLPSRPRPAGSELSQDEAVASGPAVAP